MLIPAFIVLVMYRILASKLVFQKQNLPDVAKCNNVVAKYNTL